MSLAAFAIAVACYYPFSPDGRQSANMRRAERHTEKLRAQIAADTRFAAVRMAPNTAHGGCLHVLAVVPTKEDAAALRAIVERSNPPVPVLFTVSVQGGG